MSKISRRHNRSKKRPSRGKVNQSKRSNRSSNHQVLQGNSTEPIYQTTETRPDRTRWASSLLHANPRFTTFMHLLLQIIGGGTIGLVFGFVVTYLHTKFDDPWPYIISGLGLLSLETIRNWLYYFLYPPAMKYIKQIGRDVLRKMTGVILSDEQAAMVNVEWGLGKHFKIVTVAVVTLATYLTTSGDGTFPIRLCNDFIRNCYYLTVTYYQIATIAGASGMLLLGLSNQEVIQVLVRGKPKYQIAAEANQQH